jgi:hypothetical protein
MKPLYLLFSLFFFLASSVANAQDRQQADTTVSKSKGGVKKNKKYVIVLNDGTEYIGEVLADDGREILVDLPHKGKVYIPKYEVRSIDPVTESNIQDEEYLNENKFPNYYILGTNALPFKKRQFTANMFYIGAASINYNVNERYSLGISTTFWGSPIALNAKTSFEISPKNYVGFDFHGGTIVYTNPGALFGHLGGKFTHGDAEQNFTFSGGLISYSMKRNVYSSSSSLHTTPIVESHVSYYLSVAGAKRLSKTNVFVGELNIFPNNNFALMGIGLRSVKKETSSFVFGIYGLTRLSPNNPNTATNPNQWVTPSGFYYNNPNFPFIPIPYFGTVFKL